MEIGLMVTKYETACFMIFDIYSGVRTQFTQFVNVATFHEHYHLFYFTN